MFSLISIAAGYTLWKKHVWKSVRWAVAAIWLIGPFSSLVTVLIAIPAAPLFVEFGENPDIDFYPTFLWSIIWTSFLLRSKRVRNTYRRDDA